MGLKLKSQIILILFLPMSLVIILMSYFNISILENTLIQSATQLTASTADRITADVSNILDLDRYPGRSMTSPDREKEKSLERYLGGFEDLRVLALLDNNGTMIFQSNPRGSSFASKNRLLLATLTSKKRTSHLWAYKDAYDQVGESLSHTGIMDPRVYSYEYFVPLFKGTNLIGVAYISFSVKTLSRLVKLNALGNITLVFIFLVSIFVGLSIWCDNAITRPLGFILQAQDKLAQGDFDIRVNLDIVQTNELAKAYNSFNRMAEDLKGFREELEKKNTSLKDLNQQYRKLNERLEQEVQEKTNALREFFSLITHDLKVPLAASAGYTDLLLNPKTGQLSDKQKKFLNSISMANSHLLHLVRNMLDSVKYDAGKISYYKDQFKLSELVEEVRSNLHLFLEERELSLEVSIPPECDQVYADRMRIGQVITNLISNAIEISPAKEKIILDTEVFQDKVQIRISDRGPGIAREHQDSIFDKFTQFPHDSKSAGGMGLGLYIVKKILEGHSEGVRISSEPGAGSTFIFSLPKAMPEGEPAR